MKAGDELINWKAIAIDHRLTHPAIILFPG